MPAPKPPEFRRRALDLVRQGDQPVAKIAKIALPTDKCLNLTNLALPASPKARHPRAPT